MSDHQEKVRFELIGDVVRIFQRGSWWHANYQLHGRQLRVSLKTTSKKEARRQAIKLEADIIEGRHHYGHKKAPIGPTIQAYLKHLRTEGCAPRTLIKYNTILTRLLDLASRRCARNVVDINLNFIDAYRQERVDKGISPKTLYNETVIVRGLVLFALRRELIVSDPLKGMRLKKPKPTRQPCWTPPEVEKILASCQPSERPKFLLLAETGMRFGELANLTWEDVDFENNVLRIRPKEGWRPKTGDQRSIPMAPRVQELLRSLSKQYRWVVTAAPSKEYPDGGRQISERRLLRSLKRVLDWLGLKGKLHTFRHAFISKAVTRGADRAYLRKWVGHVDPEMLDIYTHIADTWSQAMMLELARGDGHRLLRNTAVNEPSEPDVGSAQSQHNERSDQNG
jgi:integrase